MKFINYTDRHNSITLCYAMYLSRTPLRAVVEALIELQALRLPRAVELCQTSAERYSGADVHRPLHGALQKLCTNLHMKLCKGSARSST